MKCHARRTRAPIRQDDHVNDRDRVTAIARPRRPALLDPAAMRKHYRAEGLAETELAAHPMEQFARWFGQAARAAGRAVRAERHGRLHGGRGGPAQLAHGAAEAVRRAGLRLLHQLRVPQGARPGRQPVRLAALPVAPDGPPGHRHGHGAAHRPRRDGRVLPHPAARLPARRLGQRPVLGDLLPRRTGRLVRGAEPPATRRASRSRSPRTGAASASPRRRSSSGRAARTGCTTGCGTWRRRTAAGGWSGSVPDLLGAGPGPESLSRRTRP